MEELRSSPLSEVEELNRIILEQNDQLVAISRFIQKLDQSLTLDEVCNALVSALREDLGVDRFLLAVRGEADGFKAVRTLGLPAAGSEEILRCLDEHPVRLALATGRRLGRIDCGTAPSECDCHFDEWTIWPLKGRRQVLGVLIMNDPGADRRDGISLLINQAGVFVENSLLFERVKAVNDQLYEANRRLMYLDRQKTEFLSMLAHDLRTPLTSIRSYTELLGMYADESAEVRQEFLDVIRKESIRLEGLINDFLDLSRMETGTIRYERAPFSIGSVIRHFASVYDGEARHRRIDFRVSVDEDLPQVMGDQDRIGQVLSNLLSNAFKFISDGGSIRVRAERYREMESGGAEEVRVTVEDSGPGIESKYHRKIFEKFGQVEDRAGKHKGGTGLGLAIAREIVRRHQGKIWVESAPGEGARFAFTLPVWRKQTP